MTLAEVALELGVTTESLEILRDQAGLPLREPDEDGNVSSVAEVRRWRRGLQPRFITFASIDHRARVLRETLEEQGVDGIEPLHCHMCVTAGAPHVASRQCELCDRAVCPPHSCHYLRRQSNPREAAVACDECFDQWQPDCF